MGALVRSLNIRPFSWKDTVIRAITGGFASSLSLMYLHTTVYPVAMQGVICGVVGLLGADLLDAVRIRMYKDIAGEAPQDDEQEN